ncbi:G-type lectin S-receptor-like serine/threonine-protein kinase At5g35370 [Vigna unguiculata]|uniref:G-type lectin S-receptor-like serine/threonine-protein kinase At5g35370 n=1 Tax=Vigna unguiculata TaxID=3917 RepID=UPI001016B31A|nr:G-type lectin S-receptor-like serine/threonine-protein kinase At5g35370 [Vigna unguiculata]
MKPILTLSCIFFLCNTISARTFSYITPNFTASYLHFIDDFGTFLLSPNNTFKAAIFNPGGQQKSFYLCVIHDASNTIIWSANRDAPISDSGQMLLTVKGITILDQDGNPKWSTPSLKSEADRLVLTEMGNLVLQDKSNGSLWESFQSPTDTIVVGQRLPVGASLSSAASNSNLSTGDFKFTISSSDAVLQWFGQTYWKLSTDTKVFKNSNDMVEYMAVNNSGFYLFGDGGTAFQLGLPLANFRIATLGTSGQFTINSFSDSGLTQEFVGPSDGCQTPLACGRAGLCTKSTDSSSPVCSCPPNFRVGSGTSGGCVLSNGSYSLPLACENSAVVSFLNIGYVQYFGTFFTDPVMYKGDLSSCQKFCSNNCSCLGILYKNTSGSCYTIENELGSIQSSNGDDRDMLGFVKTNVVESKPGTNDDSGNKQSSQNGGFPVAVAVLLPVIGFIILMAIIFLAWRRLILVSKIKEVKLGKNSPSSGDLDAFYIPGLPARFDYEELEEATENFKTLIGSGGFGTVYKGVLPDKSAVAVKKIVNIGIQGKKDFCTEIAVIGNIHHVNLVKLKGFCAQGRHRLLVYEYMNRGSLDRNLFGGGGPVLEWQERFEVALGTARGLAYLHSGCEQKVIHCDIKPENILLQDQFQAKISDFGLSKLLSPEQSGLFTTMRGTRGYLAPEWLTNSAITEKTDVYSFGMVLLELVSGRKNCSFRSRSHSMDESSSGGHSSTSSTTGLVYFPLFALEMHEQKSYLELADPRLEGRVTYEEVEKVIRIALCCVHEEPVLRPNMVTVVGMLEGGTPLPHPRIESLNFLRFYGRRFTEASTIAEETEYGSLMHHEARRSTSIPSDSPSHGFSYMSSQNISGPR